MKKIIHKTLLVFSVMAVALLLVTGYGCLLSPASWSYASLLGYAFPVALALTLTALVLCALMRKRLLPITVIGLIAAYQPVTLYCPVNKQQETPEEAFTLLSYNTYSWGQGDKLPEDRKPMLRQIIDYIASSKADIICLQEAPLNAYAHQLLDTLNTLSRDSFTMDAIKGVKHGEVTIITRYPITRKQLIPYDTKGNVSGAFWLNVGGREVIVVNNHLQTMGFSMKERRDFGTMMHGERNEKEYIKNTSHTIVDKIVEASRIRASQADSVAAFIRRHNDTPLIVCGDFNDIPQSYTHHAITHPGKTADGSEPDITDCYRAAALGPGFSYGQFAMRVRIDNILCNDRLTPYNCRVDKSIDASDHYPMICHFTIR